MRRLGAIAALAAALGLVGCAHSGQHKVNVPKVCKATCAVARPVCGAILAACAAHEQDSATEAESATPAR